MDYSSISHLHILFYEAHRKLSTIKFVLPQICAIYFNYSRKFSTLTIKDYVKAINFIYQTNGLFS